MFKVLIAGLTAASISFTTPVATQGEVNHDETADISLAAQFEKQLESIAETKTKYAAADINVRKEPGLESEVLQTIPMNTPVETVLELDGWAMVRSEDGYAYIAADCLRDAPVVNRWNYNPTQEERNLIYRIVMLESGAEPDLGQQAVTEVIMNMTLDSSLGDHTIYGVLSKKNQYSTWKYRNSPRATPTEQVKRNVDYVLDGKSNILPFNTIYFSRKAQTSRIQAVIGRHVFCNR
ncbi:cell wall hydrolase [Clostridium sp. AM58-1XD]|uniref:cell wall hydrolase n=1 Tax=Clostridium sp. AM58-1XD TaxID=2292307 RepID=UPI000E4E1518|nr:cell wall hydrolase [Clostridium sp. AM58-1XD]RGY97471.1 hypothetical protein DXA13_14260 [Clostridium sp. AM58-1XD]